MAEGQPPSQFPPPHAGDETEIAPMERLEAPPAQAQTAMAAHLHGHGIDDFALDQHVHLGGPRTSSQLLTWNPVKATFACRKCPGRVFATGEITDEIVRSAQRWDTGLQAHLVGLSDQAERDEMTRRYLDGTLNRERLRSLRSGGARRRASAGTRPSVDRRRSQLQAWMLVRVRVRGVVERVLEEAEAMQRNAPDAWAALSDRPLSKETLRDYWQDIEPADRDAALQTSKKST
jgi:hypothetical protein